MAASGTQRIPAPVPPPPRPLVAPLWHTVLLLFLLLAPLSWWLPVKKMFIDFEVANRGLLYLLQLEFQWILFFVMVLGLMAGGTRFGGLVGGRWRTERDFLRDLGRGLAVMILNILIAYLIAVVVRPTHQESRDPIDPRTILDLAGFIPIALTAGFTEEAICRGYLQRQLLALTGNPVIAIGVQALIFSLSHGFTLPIYDLAAKFIGGLLFGALAFRSKSLLPGMVGHAAQDCIVGFVAFLVNR